MNLLDTIALYARVSSEQQAQACTIQSQVSALKERIVADEGKLLAEYEFVDDGYSGSTLMRPALEQLRDAIANRQINKLYIHSPDRLARKYAYQYLLIEEFKKCNVEIIFLNNQGGNNPETDLLLQVQGIISEYERTKIMERSRRGKLHAARKGSVSVLSGAPFGYRYISKSAGDGVARFEVIEEQAKIVRQIFTWIAKDRMSINGVANHLSDLGVATITQKNKRWNVGSVQNIVSNPAYKGKAAFGRRKSVPRKSRLKPNKGDPIISRNYYSTEAKPECQWILMDVLAIVDIEIFEQVQQQLAENKKRKREQKHRVKFLLSGLIVCKKCEYSYVGNCVSKQGRAYYVCGSQRIYSNRREKVCDNKSIRTHLLDEIVWNEIQYILNHPECIRQEYQRRRASNRQSTTVHQHNELKKEKSKITKSIERLIDIYTDGSIAKTDFTPRITILKKRLCDIQQTIENITNTQLTQSNLDVLISNLVQFTNSVKLGLKNLTWEDKRKIIVALIKRVEVGLNDVNIEIMDKNSGFFSADLARN